MKLSKKLAAIVATLALVVTACGSSDAPQDLADDTPDTTAEPTNDTPDTTAEPTNDAPDTTAAPTDEPLGSITVGLINPLTGPFAGLGEDVNAGFSLYVEENGGLLGGYEVEILTEDTANDPAAATEAVERLILSEEADVLVGFVNSGVAYGAAPFIVDENVPLIITTAGADGLTQGQGGDNIMRVSYTSSQDAMPLGAYACDELGLETMTIVSFDYSFGWEATGGFSRVYEDAGCDVIQEIYVPLGTEDWAPFIQQIDSSSDGVWALAAGGGAISFMQAYRDFGIEQPLLGLGTLTDEGVLAGQQQLADGVITSLHYSAVLDNPANHAFIELFEASAGRQVSQYAEHGWVAAQVIEQALGSATPEDSEAMIAAMVSATIDAPRGELRFDGSGQAIYDVHIRQVTEGSNGWENTVIDSIEDVGQTYTYSDDEYYESSNYSDRKGEWSSN